MGMTRRGLFGRLLAGAGAVAALKAAPAVADMKVFDAHPVDLRPDRHTHTILVTAKTKAAYARMLEGMGRQGLGGAAFEPRLFWRGKWEIIAPQDVWQQRPTTRTYTLHQPTPAAQALFLQKPSMETFQRYLLPDDGMREWNRMLIEDGRRG